MEIYWTTVNDDRLKLVDKTVNFLQTEFCPAGADPMWSVEYFRWKLGEANPAGKGYISLAMIDDKVVGVVSLTRKRVLINGVEYAGGEVGDSYSSGAIRRNSRPDSISSIDSNPDSYINKSIFGRLASDVRSRAEADGTTIIYGTPNKNAYPGWIKRLNYFDLTAYDNGSFSRPTTKLLTQIYPALNPLAPVLRAVDFFLQSAYRTLFGNNAGKGLEIDANFPASAEIEALWNRVKPTHGFSLVRDSAYWRHRYLDHPFAQYSFFSIRQRGKLAGIVVARFAVIADCKCVVYLAEWMLEDIVGFGYVLSSIMAHYRHTDVQTFNFWARHDSDEAQAAAKALFFYRNRVPIIFADSSRSRSLLDSVSEMKFYLGSADAV